MTGTPVRDEEEAAPVFADLLPNDLITTRWKHLPFRIVFAFRGHDIGLTNRSLAGSPLAVKIVAWDVPSPLLWVAVVGGRTYPSAPHARIIIFDNGLLRNSPRHLSLEMFETFQCDQLLLDA